MVAMLVTARPELLLVVVPSDALRHQLAMKFESLGALQAAEVIATSALRPVVEGKRLQSIRPVIHSLEWGSLRGDETAWFQFERIAD